VFVLRYFEKRHWIEFVGDLEILQMFERNGPELNFILIISIMV
jgi:hypothetical protein